MKKSITFILLSVLFIGMINAQSKSTGFLFDLTLGSVKLNTSGYNMGLASITPYYKPTDNLSIGVGAGVLLLFDANINSVPIYGYGRWDFLTGKKISPYLSAKAGYGIISKNERYTHVIFDENLEMQGVNTVDRTFTGGLFGTFSVGFLYHLRRNRALSFGLTPTFQKMRGTDNTGTEINFRRDYNNVALSLDIGMVF